MRRKRGMDGDWIAAEITKKGNFLFVDQHLAVFAVEGKA